MTKDIVVIDIETKNSFAEVGGQEYLKNLEISFVGVYSYNQDKYLCFYENQLDELATLLQKAGLIVGFSINRFDIPIIAKHCKYNLLEVPRLDLLDEIELLLGHRISLDVLSKTNLNVGKTHHSLEAIRLYREGKMDELRDYCLNDVKLTKDLYELAKKQGYLMIPKKITGELVKAHLVFKDHFMHQSLF